MKRKGILQTAFTLTATLLLAACTQDETIDNNTLPEGKYPLQIASVTMNVESSQQPWGANAPQTRVVENTDGNSSVWQDGDKIKVQIGDGTPGTYTYQEGSLTVANGDAPAYWASKTDGQTIKAWYTSSDNNETVDLSDQKSGLAYVMTAQATANFNQPVSLTFSHALAKVRVNLTGEIASLVDDVCIKGYTTCTLTQGTLANESNVGEIKMHKVADKTFEANVYKGYEITEFKVDNGGWTSLSSNVTPVAGNMHTITISVTGGTTINLSEQSDVYTVESNKRVIINGGNTSLNKRIIIKQGAKVMLQNIKLAAPQNKVNTIEVQGTALLVLSGTNEIKGSDRCPLAVTNGTLTINGTDTDQLKLTGGQSTDAGCLGLNSGTNLIINGGHIVADGSKTEGAGIGSYWTGDQRQCGSITINGGKIEAMGGTDSAGIGAGNQCRCGDITITGGNVTAKGGGGKWGGAGIGSSSSGGCGNITISGKNTSVTATAGSNSSDDIGNGDDGSCGTVTITDATVIATNGRIHGH